MRFRSSRLLVYAPLFRVPHRWRVTSHYCLWTGILVCGCASVAEADALAQDILKKMAGVYDVKTFQGTVTMTQTGMTDENKPYTLSSVEEVTFKRPNMFYVKNAGPGVGGTQISVFNGREAINYISARNQYVKTTVQSAAAMENVPLLSLLGVRFDIQSGKVVSSTTVAGKPAYVVQVMPPIPALPRDATATTKTQLEQLKKLLVPYELAIDKKEYRLLRVIQKSPDVKMTRILEVTQQTLNPNIAESAFVFTPPAGAKLLSQHTMRDRAQLLAEVNGQADKTRAHVGRGSGSPMPPPHASPGANGVGHKQ